MTETHSVPTVEALLAQTDWLKRLARSLVRDSALADDLSQDAAVLALAKAPSDPGVLRGWLRVVTRNLALQAVRSSRRRAEREAATARSIYAPSSEALVERVELQELLARAVRALVEPYRSTIALRYFEELSVREIATRQGVPIGTVETRLRRGLARLREILDGEYGGKRQAWFAGLVRLANLEPAAATGAGVGSGLLLGAAGALLLGGLGFGYFFLRGGANEPRLEDPRIALAQAPRVSAGSSTATDAADPLPASSASRTGVAVAPRGELHQLVLRIVRDGDGLDLPGAELRLRIDTERDGTKYFDLVADEAGRAEVNWSWAWTRLELDSPGTESTARVRFELDRTGEHTLRLPRRGGTLTGQVLDPDGRPLPSAEILFRRGAGVDLGPFWDELRVVTTTAADGRFVVTDVAHETGSDGSFVLAARTPELRSTHRITGHVAPGDATEVRLDTGRVRELRGRVSSSDGAPLEGLEVVACRPPSQQDIPGLLAFWKAGLGKDSAGVRKSGPRRAIAVRAVTDERGEFALAPLTVEPWLVQVDHPAYPRWQGTGAADAEFLEVVMRAGTDLVGRVVNNGGEPLPGVRVGVDGLDARADVFTDADGRFEFLGLTPMDGALLRFDGAGLAMHVVVVDIPAARRDPFVVEEVRLVPGLTLTGRVLDEAGRPRPSSFVQIEGERAYRSVWFPADRGWTWERSFDRDRAPGTGSDGAFRFDGLYAGSFRITLTDTDNRILAIATARAGDQDLVLQVGAGLEHGATFRGQVRFEETDQPCEDFVVSVYAERGEGPDARTSLTFRSTGGHFEVPGMKPGRLQLHVHASEPREDDWFRPFQEFAAGIHELDIALKPRDDF